MSAKTYAARESEIERRWFVVDATDETLGRLASRDIDDLLIRQTLSGQSPLQRAWSDRQLSRYDTDRGHPPSEARHNSSTHSADRRLILGVWGSRYNLCRMPLEHTSQRGIAPTQRQPK